jgi:hypothetical protein
MYFILIFDLYLFINVFTILFYFYFLILSINI